MAELPDNEKEVLGLSLEELRRLYDNICTSFDHLRTKSLALLAGEVAIVTFLFASDGSDKTFFPDAIYGLVFASIGVVFLGASFVLFLWALAPTQWHHPPDTKRLQDPDGSINRDPKKFLRYLKNDYITTIRSCIMKISSRAKGLTWGIYLLSIGIFILILIKYGGSNIRL